MRRFLLHTRLAPVLTALALSATLAQAPACDDVAPSTSSGGAAITVPAAAPPLSASQQLLPGVHVETPPDFDVVIGTYDPAAGYAFGPLDDGQDAEIVQGPQGGIHLSVALEADLADLLGQSQNPLFVDITATVDVDGDEVAVLDIEHFAVSEIAWATYRTSTLPVVFDEHLAAPYVGKAATLTAEIFVGDLIGRGTCELSLVDLD